MGEVWSLGTVLISSAEPREVGLKGLLFSLAPLRALVQIFWCFSTGRCK